MFLPNPSRHGRGIQPWRSPSPLGRLSPIPRRWLPFPGRLSPVSNPNTIAIVKRLNMLCLLGSNPEPRRDRLLMVNNHGIQGFPSVVFFGAGKQFCRSVSVVSAGARFRRFSGWVGNPVLLCEGAGSRMAEKMKASEWMAGSKQMANLRAIGGKTVGFWIAGRVPVWLLLKVPPWKDSLLQGSKRQRLAPGLTSVAKNPLGFEVTIPISPGIGARKFLGCRYNSDICKRRAARILLGPTEVIKPVVDWKSQPPVFHSGWPEKVARLPSLLMQFPDKGGCKAARVWKWAWVLGPGLIFKPIDVTV